jgi:hypothetical protein
MKVKVERDVTKDSGKPWLSRDVQKGLMENGGGFRPIRKGCALLCR